ncbi:MAG: terminase, partial [Planctomycetaceae bacterium]|nr:terminase [Planctomycetaceae bacterium]
MQKWQVEDFAALDPGWLRLAGQTAESAIQLAYLERPRGHSKTTDMAVQLAWILQHSLLPVEGLAAAADLDQGKLILNAVERIAKMNPRFCDQLEFRQQSVFNRETGSRLTIISSDVQSSWGQLPDFVICDELSHWEKPELWYSLLSSAAKKPNCMLVVLTNAGVGRGWQWDVREAARESSRWHFSSLKGCQAPWIKPEWLEDQRQLLPASVFDRLWNNSWQMSDGGFVSLEEAEACRDETLLEQQQGRPDFRYIAAIDYAEKHDYTVGVVLHREGDRYVVDRMDVIRPQPDCPVPVSWVEQWIERMSDNFTNIFFLLDEYQLLSTIQKYQSRVEMERFQFMAGKGNHALPVNLRKLILHRQIAWHAGCGQLDDTVSRDDLETELASVLLKQKSSGMCRIDHVQDRIHHDDRVFALGAAA